MKKEKNNYHGREWYDDEYTLFENDDTLTEQIFDLNIRLETPDGITTSRLLRVIQRALSDSLYLYDEVKAHTVSGELIETNEVDVNAEVFNFKSSKEEKKEDKLNALLGEKNEKK